MVAIFVGIELVYKEMERKPFTISSQSQSIAVNHHRKISWSGINPDG
jgi:hypothetical protein